MARKKIKLTKKVYSNQKIRDQVSLDFQKLAKTKHSVNEKRLKEIYDEIFYDIPINGKNSHKNIVEQTYEYLYHNRSKNLESIIKNLSQQVIAKTTELEAYNVSTPEHDVYENGALLMHGTNGQPYQDSNYIWVMQEGRKRRFESQSDPVFLEVKKALSLPDGANDGRYYVSTEDLNSIPDGRSITTTRDLNLKGSSIIPTQELADLEVRHAYYTVEIECLGNEVADFSEQVINGEINTSQLQFYLGSSGCTVRYFKDDFSTDADELSIETVQISKGQTVTLDILREGLGPEDSGIPFNSNDYYTALGSYNLANLDYYGNDVSDYIKNWGPFGEYEGIAYATGRLMIRQLPNPYIQDVLLIPQDTSQTILNGLPESTTIGGTESSITIIQPGTNSSYTGQERSAYNTKMIYKGQNLWGSLNQNNELQNEVFDSPNNKYYKKTISVDKGIGNTPIYGQPILRYMSTYCVLLGGFSENATRKLRFLDLLSGDFFTRRRGQVEDDLNWEMITSSGLGILGMKWDSEKLKGRVVDQGYVGLQEYKTNMYEGQGNYYNPSTTGNNYSWPFPSA